MRPKVCLLEDDPLALAHIADMLTELGYDALAATTVDQALALIREHRPAAVVADILMPEKDGLNFLMELGADRPARVVAISGGGRLSSSAVLTMARGLGADVTLGKPFSTDELRTALEAPPDPRGMA